MACGVQAVAVESKNESGVGAIKGNKIEGRYVLQTKEWSLGRRFVD